MKKKIIVLGAGMVGKAMAIDLCSDYAVTSADISRENLKKLNGHPVKIIEADLSDAKTIKKIIAGFDLVVGAVPGFMGFEMVKNVLEAGKNIVDISFFPEDIFLLDDLAKKKNAVAVMDCGVAPGMDNILLGYHNQRMEVENFECYVGGLPFARKWPYEYKAPFSPIDVIEEYIRPARYIKDGKMIHLPALTEPELMEFEQVGTLEAFNTDGLRSLVKTMNIPNMKERTLRYPGHIELMRVLRETGFFAKEEMEVKGKKIRPIDLASKLLFSKWKLQEGEDEFTVMRVIVEGKEKKRKKKYTYDLFDRYDKATHTSSMARTTGYTCTAVARLVVEGIYKRKGISPPEFVGEEELCMKQVLKYLEERNIFYKLSTENF